MRNNKNLLVEQTDNKIAPFQKVKSVIVPETGWISVIRKSLNMTLAQLGEKLGISRQGVKHLEDSEAKGSISLNTLKDIGEAMDLKLVYGFVPKDGSIENLIERKARDLAAKIVLRTNHNMALEDQAIYGDKIGKNIEELAEEFKRELNKSLWD
ncbi:mobile mystery protein A [Brumimicrobium oceani]|uniref:Mobile mystery protein A n=1 Tax=Brumimicrobium oceani TaxID=2100725 RepID=A0A2U2X379_9FLAO|nr:mobile mystery protein A [Brumimicrobium oceani]PWH82238.1 mobile mystery protein A [Brumimicrobium oceani]